MSQPIDGVLPPHQNSIGIYIHEIAKLLSDRCEVHVLTARKTDRVQRERVDGVSYHFLACQPEGRIRRVMDRLAGRTAENDLLHPDYGRHYASEAARVLQRIGCQVAHVINFAQFGPTLRRFNPTAKLVLQMRCEWLNQLDFGRLMRDLSNFDAVLGCSRHITDQASARFPSLGLKFVTIYNGIDTGRFAYNPDLIANRSKQVLFVGRISPEKGIHTLIEAFALARAQDPDLSLCLVGGHSQLPAPLLVDLSHDPLVRDLRRFYGQGTSDEYWRAIQGKIGECDLAAAVSLPGNLSYGEVVDHFQRSALLVNPSLSESFGRAPAEAASIGLPVVATRVGGLPEVVLDGQTGLLVPGEQPEQLAAAILRLSSDQELRQRVTRAARRHMQEHFSWQVVSDRVAELNRSLLAAPSP